MATGRYGAAAGRGKKITEDDPRFDPRTMGNRTGWYKGVYYVNGKPARDTRNYTKGSRGG